MAVFLSGEDGRRRAPFPKHPSAVALSIALAAGMGSALAQSPGGEGSPQQLDAVVVSASGFEQQLKEAPASISVVSRDSLESKPYRDLAEALQDVEGIDVRGATGKTGGLNISIRGMPSEYTLILIDGRRQNVAGDITPNGFGDALTSFIPPVSAIERIEVIRGPMSTLYGSDAMGGVINIITRKVAKTWSGSVTAELGLPQDSEMGDSRKASFYASGPLAQDRLGLAVRGSVFRREESDLTSSSAGGVISTRGPSPAESRQHELGARLTLTPNKANDLWLDVSQARTWYDNAECELGTVDRLNCTTGAPNATISGYRDFMRFNRDQVALGYAGRLAFGTVETSLTRSTTETIGRTIPSAARPAGDPSIGTGRELETTNTVLDAKLIKPLGDQHLLTVGGQYWDADMVDGLVSNTFQQKLWALFVEDEWRFRPNFAATLGLRYDHHDAFGGEVSPRGYLVWNATQQLTVKGGVSQGFKAPRLNQLVDGVNGISGQGVTINIGNPNLKPETSTSTEIGVLWDNLAGATASVTLFHNRVKDKISGGGDCTVDYISSCAANPVASYSVNNDEGKTWGAEFGTRVALDRHWTVGANYTWTDSELIVDGAAAGQLSDTAKHIANAFVRWAPNETWGMWLRYEYRGKSRRFDGDPAALSAANRLEYNAIGDLAAYGLWHLGGHYRVTKGITLRASVNNLLDKDFRRFTPFIDGAGNTVWANPYLKSTAATKGFLPAGRTLWLSASFEF